MSRSFREAKSHFARRVGFLGYEVLFPCPLTFSLILKKRRSIWPNVADQGGIPRLGPAKLKQPLLGLVPIADWVHLSFLKELEKSGGFAQAGVRPVDPGQGPYPVPKN